MHLSPRRPGCARRPEAQPLGVCTQGSGPPNAARPAVLRFRQAAGPGCGRAGGCSERPGPETRSVWVASGPVARVALRAFPGRVRVGFPCCLPRPELPCRGVAGLGVFRCCHLAQVTCGRGLNPGSRLKSFARSHILQSRFLLASATLNFSGILSQCQLLKQ